MVKWMLGWSDGWLHEVDEPSDVDRGIVGWQGHMNRWVLE